jgi:hypothetical protein
MAKKHGISVSGGAKVFTGPQSARKLRGHRGIEQYTTRDGVRVLRLHYSADPDKDPDTEKGMRWFESQVKGYPGGQAGSKWQQEMEINFQIYGGRKVYPDWEERLPHVAVDPFKVPEEWPIYAGYDYGTSNPFAFTPIAFASTDLCFQIDEIVHTDLSVPQQAKMMMAKPYWGRVRGIVGDPSIWRRTQSGDEERLKSIGEMFEEEGVFIERGRNEAGVDMSYVALLDGYLWDSKTKPKFKIFSHCKETLKCYRNLRKKQHTTAHAIANMDDPEGIVQKGIDAFDANKYVLLSRGFETPHAVVSMPGTWGWWEEQIEKKARRGRNVLR